MSASFEFPKYSEKAGSSLFVLCSVSCVVVAVVTWAVCFVFRINLWILSSEGCLQRLTAHLLAYTFTSFPLMSSVLSSFFEISPFHPPCTVSNLNM